MNKKRVIAAVFVGILLIGSLGIAQRLLVPKYQKGIVEGAMIAEYYQTDSTHEVLFIGDCEVYENFSTITLWENYGITSYIRGSANQTIWQSYYLLEEMLYYDTPEVVVYNVQALQFDKPVSETYNRMTLDGMRWSFSKTKSILESMTEEEHFIEYMFPLLRFHDRWQELKESDFTYFSEKELVTHNGYYMRMDVLPQEDFPEPTPLYDYTFGKKAMAYLQKITDLCEEKGIQLVLIKAPVEYPYWYPQWEEQVEAFAREENVTYLNLIPLKEEIGLDMSVDTYDGGLHLNTYGAEKMADYFGEWLVKNCSLTDYREDEETSEIWREKINYYNKMKELQLKELAEYGELRSFGANAIEE